MTAATLRPERRRFRISLAALAVVLPAALIVHSKGDLVDAARAWAERPIEIARDGAAAYTGAEWRLTGLSRFPGDLPNTEAVVAEFEARVADGAALAGAGPCVLRLRDAEGRQWQPSFLTESAVRRARPDLADRPRCGVFDPGVTGTVAMAASFVVPKEAEGLALSLRLRDAAGRGLVFN